MTQVSLMVIGPRIFAGIIKERLLNWQDVGLELAEGCLCLKIKSAPRKAVLRDGERKSPDDKVTSCQRI